MDGYRISSDFTFTLQRVKVLNTEMAYVDTAPKARPEYQEPVMLFLHRNPTSSYLW